MQISLDGGTAKTHDLIRGAGSFDKAIGTIRRLKKNGIEVALMPQNKTDCDSFMTRYATFTQGLPYAQTVLRISLCSEGRIRSG